MTRGTIFYFKDPENIISSVEFNGDMYLDDGVGQVVVKNAKDLKSKEDFKKVLASVNEYYQYPDGSNAYSVPYKKTSSDRTKTVNFTDITTWEFWGNPNLSDYTYLYNGSFETLSIICAKGYDEERKTVMDILPGQLGIFFFKSPYAVAEDGKITKRYRRGELVEQ